MMYVMLPLRAAVSMRYIRAAFNSFHTKSGNDIRNNASPTISHQPPSLNHAVS
jgi:hypothetical protein